MKHLLLTVFLILSIPSFSQTPGHRHTIKAGLDIPLQYKIGYSYRLNHRFSLNAAAGLLVAPFDDMLIGLMESFGVDQGVGRLMRSSFKNGKVLTFGGNYFIGQKYYAGVRMNYGIFTAEDAPRILLEGLFPEDLLPANGVMLEVRSKVWFAGLLVGRQFQLGSPRWVLNTELSFGKALASKNSTRSIPRLPLGRLDQDIDKLLLDNYRQYGYVITLNVHVGYRF